MIIKKYDYCSKFSNISTNNKQGKYNEKQLLPFLLCVLVLTTYQSSICVLCKKAATLFVLFDNIIQHYPCVLYNLRISSFTLIYFRCLIYFYFAISNHYTVDLNVTLINLFTQLPNKKILIYAEKKIQTMNIFFSFALTKKLKSLKVIFFSDENFVLYKLYYVFIRLKFVCFLS